MLEAFVPDCSGLSSPAWRRCCQVRAIAPRRRLATDHVRALEFFEDVLEHDTRVFFQGRLERTRPRAMRRRNAIVGDATWSGRWRSFRRA